MRSSRRLRGYFLSLARQVATWQRSANHFSVGVGTVSPRAGGSTVAFNLSDALAGLDGGNVLLVETDFGSTFVARRTDRRVPGLAEILAGTATIDQALLAGGVDHLYAIHSGRMRRSRAIVLPLESITSLNRELQDNFATAVFDLPAATEDSHFYSIAEQLDGVVLVTEADKTDSHRIQRVRKRLAAVGTELIGLVLNKATLP